MQIDELLELIIAAVKSDDRIASVDRIRGENAVGIESQDGQEFFVTVEPA